VLLGFSLGMRHATDADHVVAVATIVSRERSLRGAALLGSLWGVGHTVTIPFAYTARRFAGMNRRLGLVSGLLSVAFGAFLVYHIGFVDGLFTGDPRWTPQ
jgi:high-affinity nickel permease